MMLSAVALAASLSPISVNNPFTFESPAEPVPVIVSRLAEELNMPLSTAQKLSDERLVIYAPDVDPQELLDQIAWSLFAEWVPRSDGTLMLDRTPESETYRRLVLDAHDVTKRRFNFSEISAEYGRVLDRAESERLASQIREFLMNTPPPIYETFEFQVNAGGFGFAGPSRSRSLSQEESRLLAVDPETRFAARLLALLPGYAYLPRSHPRANGRAPDYVISSRPSAAEIDASGHRDRLFRLYRSEVQEARLMSQQYIDDWRAVSSYEGYVDSIGRGLQMIQEIDSSIVDFTARVSNHWTNTTVEIFWFDREGNFVHQSRVNFSDYEASPIAGEEPREPTFEAMWLNPVPVSQPGGRIGHLLANAQSDPFFTLQLEAARLLGKEKNKPVIFPALSWHAFPFHAERGFNVANVLNTIMDHAENGESADGQPALAVGDRWFTGRAMTFISHSNLIMPDSDDQAELAKIFRRAIDRGQSHYHDYISIAKVVDSPLVYNWLTLRLEEMFLEPSVQARRKYSMSYDQARLLGDLVRNDFRRLNSGALLRFGQLTALGQEVVHHMVFQHSFLMQTVTWREDSQFRSSNAHGFGQTIYATPTKAFGDTVHAQTRVRFSVEDTPMLRTRRWMPETPPEPQRLANGLTIHTSGAGASADASGVTAYANELRRLTDEGRPHEVPLAYVGYARVFTIEIETPTGIVRDRVTVHEVDYSRGFAFSQLPQTLQERITRQMERPLAPGPTLSFGSP